MSWREELKSPGIRTKGAKSVDAAGSLWTKCLNCGAILYRVEIEKNAHVCLKCHYHFPMPVRERIQFLADPESFEEFDSQMQAVDILGFVDLKSYPSRLKGAQEKTGEKDAAVWGTMKIEGHPLVVTIFNFDFLGGSMGVVVGEKVTRCFEYALEHRVPALVISSSGGARMQEGIFSLMQMAKTCAALDRLKDAGVPYISLMAHPTTGGVAASFAMLGDIHLTEPEALIGFAGPRVIEQTIRQSLPEGFQRAPFLMEHGMIDQIIERKDQRKSLGLILRLLKSTTTLSRSSHSQKNKP